MPEVVRFELSPGMAVYVDADDLADGPTHLSRRGAEGARPAAHSLPAVLDQVGATIDAAMTRLRALGDAPEEVEIEFAVRLSGEYGAVITKMTGEASMRVRAVWKKAQDS
ncbi:CU044_2847 family protein [Allonocardiopsis opalescens]|uniref:Trypsin-co-occurring domain-containing protein n=1 Tax=Allonocardiopsis opalescens TaxID=1144618 RepID=A0A2T0QFT0_9ACTN|nr:CU044_2847 family protein [Allonocardiopsis opalescens]PRY02703.1 hypothetical protein CLV72_1011306 [Allonocardiopsis opalescens]